jgi:hypothetical protein
MPFFMVTAMKTSNLTKLMTFQNELSALNEGEEEEKDDPVPQPRTGPTAASNPGPSLAATLEDRKKMYQDAERNAQMAGETSRARR